MFHKATLQIFLLQFSHTHTANLNINESNLNVACESKLVHITSNTCAKNQYSLLNIMFGTFCYGL